MQKYIYSLLLVSLFLLSGCEGEEGENESGEESATAQGWHFQGRDCLACHNFDLAVDKHLLFGGTVYKDTHVTNQDDINNVCGGELLVNFLDATTNALVYSSKDYKDSSSKGYKGKGNIFVLQRRLRLMTAGTYRVQITDVNGNVMAVSGPSHKLTSQDYDINNSDDDNNRLSCNSCHVRGGKTDPLFVQANQNLCQ